MGRPGLFQNIRVYWLAFVVYWGFVLFGYDTGVSGGVVSQPYFRSHFGITDAAGNANMQKANNINSNVVSVLQAGAFFGALGSAPLSAAIGRKWSLFVWSLIFSVGAILQTIAGGTRGLGYVYSGRVVAGIGVGAISAVAPTFVSECAPKEVRARLTGLNQVMIGVGLVLSYFINFGVSAHVTTGYAVWRIPFGFQLVPAGLMSIGLLTVKESPRWLASVGHIDRAFANLAYLRRLPIDDSRIRAEMAEIEAAMSEEREARKGMGGIQGVREAFLGKGNGVRFVIAIVIFVLQNWNGQNSVGYYAPQIFSQIGYTGTTSSLLASGIYGIMKLLATTTFVFFLFDSFGRKYSLFISSIGMGVLFFIIGALLKEFPPPKNATSPPPASKAMAAMLYIYVVLYSMGWGPLPWVYVSDIFPTRTRHYGLAIGSASQWVSNFTISKATPTLQTELGYKMFFMFGSIDLVVLTTFSLLIPETKGRSLEEMDIIFGAVQEEKRRADIAAQERALQHDVYSPDSELGGSGEHDLKGIGLDAKRPSLSGRYFQLTALSNKIDRSSPCVHRRSTFNVEPGRTHANGLIGRKRNYSRAIISTSIQQAAQPIFNLPPVDAATVKLDNATVVGLTSGSVTSYWGIRYAQPPVGDLRLRLPKSITSYTRTFNATHPGVRCVQLSPPLRSDLPLPLVKEVLGYSAAIASNGLTPIESEDCLTINVQVPKGTKPGDKLPVIASIYGGGFVSGDSYQVAGDDIIRRSIELKQPVIYAAMNYRLGVFAQLGGKEVKKAGVGNLSLQDQREALRWIKRYIAAFGGDPDRVTLWGVSAGAISCALQTLTNGGNTEGLFHGAVMAAGSPIPTGDITLLQPQYDQLVEEAGCSDVTDTLECLRQVPAATLVAAGETLPNLFDYAGLATIWSPYADGLFLKAPPQHLVLAQSVAKIPFISGDALDEGTVFALSAFNITTEDEFRGYIKHYFYPDVPAKAVEPIFTLYPNDPAQGSPFGTGDEYQLTPFYKRMAAFQGDYVFQAPRRFFLDRRSHIQPTWAYISERGRIGGLGYPHGTDFAQALSGNVYADYLIQFAATKNPNGGNSDRTVYWPKYDTKSRKALKIVEDGVEIGTDTDRLVAMGALSALSVAYPL